MAQNKCEFRLLTVATAVAMYLPFSTLAATDAGVAALRGITEEDIASLPPMITQQQYSSQHTSEAPEFLKSIAEMDTLGGASVVKPYAEVAPIQQAQPAPMIAQSIESPAPVKTTEAPVFARREEAPVPAKTTEAPVSARREEAPVLVKTTEAPVSARRVEAPVPVKTTEVPVFAKSIETPAPVNSTTAPALVDRRRLAMSLNNAEAAAAKSEPSAVSAGRNQAVLKNNYDYFPPVQKYYQPDPAYDNVRWNGEVDGESGKRTPANATPESFKSQRNTPSRAFCAKWLLQLWPTARKSVLHKRMFWPQAIRLIKSKVNAGRRCRSG
ncbi:hypothetical protein ACQ86O_26775 [Serratia sp. L9]|uniref:hypothetical protein n=1 Tax=Serratia sp. L9 TaxID=3423946 RepID=UPI003D67BC70